MITPCIKHYKKLDSTNSFALSHFEELAMGDVIIADIQTKGRGRFNRSWEGTTTKNLYISLILKPENIEVFPFINLTQYFSVVINRILNNNYGIKSNIKWPNDILFNGKKLAGILAEAKMSDNKIQGIVLGAGININYAPVDIFPNAESISNILGKEIDKKEITDIILKEFFEDFEPFAKTGFSFIYEEYLKMCRFNSELKIGNSYKEGEFSIYKFKELNKDGTITVIDNNTDNSKEIKIVSGDIIC